MISMNEDKTVDFYVNLGEYEKARDLLEVSLVGVIENFGENHPKVAMHRAQLAMMYIELRDYEQAYELLQSALADTIQSLGEDHSQTAKIQANLARYHQDYGEHAQSKELLAQAIDIYQIMVDEHHPQLIYWLIDYGWACWHLEDKFDAEKAWLKALKICHKVKGENDSITRELMDLLKGKKIIE